MVLYEDERERNHRDERDERLKVDAGQDARQRVLVVRALGQYRALGRSGAAQTLQTLVSGCSPAPPSRAPVALSAKKRPHGPWSDRARLLEPLAPLEGGQRVRGPPSHHPVDRPGIEPFVLEGRLDPADKAPVVLAVGVGLPLRCSVARHRG